MAFKPITTGQDSFLDIVANLVGILIILVVVVGTQAKIAWQPEAIPPDRSDEITALQAEQDRATLQMNKVQLDNQLLHDSIEQQAAYNLALSKQRFEMLVNIEKIKQEIQQAKEDQQQQLSESQRAFAVLQADKNRLSRKLEDLTRAISATSTAAEPANETIEHFPNPIAKTIFSEEVHFQIRNGLIAYVPLEELIARMKADWKVKGDQVAQNPVTVDTVGPIQNFRLQYELSSQRVSQATSQGVVQRTMIQFSGFQLFPSSEQLGVRVAESIATENEMSSEFQSILRQFPSGKTTVSLWVYPDSFSEYNQVKNWLYQQGYQVACWPLEADRWIAGGPNGFRTSAQ